MSSGEANPIVSHDAQAADSAPLPAALRPCPVCASETDQSCRIGMLPNTFGGGRMERLSYDLTYCACKALVYISPLPSSNDLEMIYVKSEQFSDPIYTDAVRVDAILGYIGSCLKRMLDHQALAKEGKPVSLLSIVKRRLGMNGSSSVLTVLEVGAGRAWLCRAAKQISETSRTVAQDVSPEEANSCDWVDHFLVCEIDDQRIEAHAPYDIISMTHVIEHLTDPVAAVRRCKKMLAPGGIIFITAPHRPKGWKLGDADISVWQNYSYNHIPAHIQYFSRDAMQKLATASGSKLSFWSDAHEDGQAFEAWLE